MINAEKIIINRAIIHRLDNQTKDKPVMSDFILDLNDDIKKVLSAHAISSIKDKKIRYAKFNDYQNNTVYVLSSEYFTEVKEFITYTHEIAKHLFSHMTSKTISSGDLVVVDLNIDGERYIAVLKLDYKDQYLSKVEMIEDKRKITLIKNDNSWPEEGTRLQKAAFVRINLDVEDSAKFDLVMLDRQKGTSGIYSEDVSIFFSKSFLNVNLIEDEQTNTGSFIKGAKTIKDEYELLGITPEKAHELYDNALNVMKNSTSIDVESFIDGFFNREEGETEKFNKVRTIFKNAGLTRNEFTKSEEVANAFLKKRRFTLDGINLSIDNAVYNDSDKFNYKVYNDDSGRRVVDINIKGIELKKME